MKPRPMRPIDRPEHDQPQRACRGRPPASGRTRRRAAAGRSDTSRLTGSRSASRPATGSSRASTMPAGSSTAPACEGGSCSADLHEHRQQVGRAEQRHAVDEGDQRRPSRTAGARTGRASSAAAAPRRCWAMKADGRDQRCTRAAPGRSGRVAACRCDHAVQQREHGRPRSGRGRRQSSRPPARSTAHAAGRADRQVACAPCQSRRCRTARPRRRSSASRTARPARRRCSARSPARARRRSRRCPSPCPLARAEGVQDDDRRDRLQHAGRQALGDAHRQHQLEAAGQAAGHAAGHAAARTAPM